MSAPVSPTAQQQPASSGLTYQEALVAAAAIGAAMAAPSPADVVASLSEGVIAGRERAAAWVKAVLRGLWAPVNPYDDRQVAAFAKKAAQAMASAQAAAARVAVAAQVKQLAAVGIMVDGAVSIPVDVRAPAARIERGELVLQHHKVTVDYADGAASVSAKDMTTEAIFARPAAAARYARSVGADPHVAALARMDHLVDDNLMLAQRQGAQTVIVEAVDLSSKKRSAVKVLGYRRVIHPEMSRGGTCGLCIVAADRIYRVGELMPIHANCKCTIAVVTADHDPGDDVNKADLKMLYKQAGGTSAAHLKRTRYKENDHGELGVVLAPGKPYKPRSESGRKIAGNTGISGKEESNADIARRLLPGFEESLANLRASGRTENDPQVVFHRTRIAQMQEALVSESKVGKSAESA